jgi:hypothetical protein
MCNVHGEIPFKENAVGNSSNYLKGPSFQIILGYRTDIVEQALEDVKKENLKINTQICLLLFKGHLKKITLTNLKSASNSAFFGTQGKKTNFFWGGGWHFITFPKLEGFSELVSDFKEASRNLILIFSTKRPPRIAKISSSHTKRKTLPLLKRFF